MGDRITCYERRVVIQTNNLKREAMNEKDKKVYDYLAQHFMRSKEYARKQFGIKEGMHSKIKTDPKRLSVFVRGDVSFSILYAENSTDEFQRKVEDTFAKGNWNGVALRNVMFCLAELCLAVVRCDDENRSYTFSYVGV